MNVINNDSEKDISFDKNLLSKIQEFANIGIWELDLKTELTKWSEQVYKIYGLDSTRSLSKDEGVSFYAPQERERLAKMIMNSIEQRKPFFGEFEFCDAKGQKKWVHSYGEPICDDEGNVVKLIGTFQDVTKRVEFEKLAQKQKEMAQHQAKLASLGELSAGVGHEINNPLSVAWSYLDLLKEKYLESDKAKEIAQKIDANLSRIKNITEGLRKFAHVDSEKKELFSIKESVEELITMIREVFHSDAIEIQLQNNLSKDLFICGSKGRLEQVFLNMFTNAKYAMKKSSHKSIDVILDEVPGQVRITISDTGSGIPEELREKIFDSFFTTKKVGDGTGLGLSLSKSIIEEFGGSLSLNSEINKGTSFIITLPVERKALFQETKEVNEKTNLSSGTVIKNKILIVDDEDGIRDVLGEMLEDLCASVSSFSRAEEAYIEYCEHPEDYDLIISDVKMPGWTGTTFLKVLRENQDIKQPRFLFITGGVNLNLDKENGDVKEEFDGCIYKPFNRKEMIKLVKSLFE